VQPLSLGRFFILDDRRVGVEECFFYRKIPPFFLFFPPRKSRRRVVFSRVGRSTPLLSLGKGRVVFSLSFIFIRGCCCISPPSPKNVEREEAVPSPEWIFYPRTPRSASLPSRGEWCASPLLGDNIDELPLVEGMKRNARNVETSARSERHFLSSK